MKLLCFFFFSRIFGLDPAQNTPFEEVTNQMFGLKFCATHAKRKQKIVQGHGQFNIDCHNIVLAFEGFKVS